MSLAFLGTSEFAVGVLAGIEPDLVVTRPDRPAGRGQKLASPPVAIAARERGLPLEQPEDVQALDLSSFDDVLVCAFGVWIKEPLISHPGLFNVHPSLLPRWRGAAPIERAIMARDESTGVCIMELTAGLDSGPVALREEVPLGPEEDFASLSARLAELGGDLLVRALDLQAEGRLEFVEQDEDGVTYAEKIDPAERRLDPALPAAELAAKVRALTPHVGAYLEAADGERLGVREAHAVEADVPPGTIEARDGALLLGCGESALRLDVVQPPGGKPMPADAYLRGHELPRL
ncbi:MAG TPA: methionyl-tRNA formyltransferase [Solirubrobacterales bacterium]|nr:methionyl-tRNA formyltransferase [Solirubrobacterales bacterium]